MLMVGLVFWTVIVELLFVLVVLLGGNIGTRGRVLWSGRRRVSSGQCGVGARGKRLFFLG